MKRSYRDRDYVFGQTMLNLRSAIGLTQTGLAEYLGVSRFAVGEWEAGNKYPKFDHLKAFIELAIQQSAFPAGHEADEIRTLWKAARQKVLLDERWLTALLTAQPDEHRGHNPMSAAPAGTRVDWGDALAIPNFYGREWEITLLTTWVVEKRCRVVSALGLGGIGKSALAVNLMRQVAEHFEVVIWRSLRDAPGCEALIDNLLQVLDPSITTAIAVTLEQRFGLLLDYLRDHRVLLVLDNLEALLEEGEGVGQMRSGYEGYGRLLSRVAETEHQSCLLLTSREKPVDLVPLEGTTSPVRSIRLTQLDSNSCERLLAEKGVAGTVSERTHLIETYTGNPLALKIVAQTIVDIFDGEIAPFLEQGEMIFGGVRELLRQQFSRLSTLEQRVLLWLAILREPTSLNELLALLVAPVSRVRLLEAMDALHRRSLVERGQKPGTFTLQSVVLESVIAQLIVQMSSEIEQGQLGDLVEHGLELAQAREYVRQTQERLILTPILSHLRGGYPESADVETVLVECLNKLRALPESAQGYAPANLVALLRVLRGHLRGLDLSHLVLRGCYLQGVEMHNTLLTEVLIRDSIFNETFDGIISLDISGANDYWAASSINGEVRVWEAGGRVLHRILGGDTDIIRRMAISPDGRSLAGGCENGTIKLWDVESGGLIWSSDRDLRLGVCNHLMFSPDGTILATSLSDRGVYLWDQASGALLGTLDNISNVPVTVWHPNGSVLASSDTVGTIYLWLFDRKSPTVVFKTMAEHTQPVTGLAFSPQGDRLASASWDGTVKIWDTEDNNPKITLTGHKNRAFRVAWSADGRVIASGGSEGIILLWDVEEMRYHAALHGHTALIRGLAFTPDSRTLVSGSEDGTIHIWDAATGVCTGVIHGYTALLTGISWSPDGLHLISAGSEPLLTLYTLNETTLPRILSGHTETVNVVEWSPDGSLIASSSIENVIRLWSGNTGEAVESLYHAEDPGNYFNGVAWSPDGTRLAAATGTHGVLLFDISTRSVSPLGEESKGWIAQLAWSPNGKRLAGISDTNAIYVWDISSGMLLKRFLGENRSLAWSMDSRYLAAGKNSEDHIELFVWDMEREEQPPLIIHHPSMGFTVTWAANDRFLITGGGDGVVRWWEVQRGECILNVQTHQGTINFIKTSPDGAMVASCGDDGAIVIRNVLTGQLVKTLRRDRPYERLNIMGIRGLTEAQKATLRALGAIEGNPSTVTHPLRLEPPHSHASGN